MGEVLVSASVGTAGNWQAQDLDGEFVGRFQLSTRGIAQEVVPTSNVEDWYTISFGLQISGFIGASQDGAIDSRLYFGTGTNKFEVFMTAGYSRGFFSQIDPFDSTADGFAFGAGIEFNPVFFWISQPIWLAIGYDGRCFDKFDFGVSHMVWVGASIIFDWLLNPERYDYST